VSAEEGEALAREYDMKFFESSAKENINVEKAYITIASDIKARLLQYDDSDHALLDTHKLTSTAGTTSACC
jgi:Ras-related protein Rab-8A